MSDSGLYIRAHFNGEQVECREAVGSVLRPKEESRACIRWQRQLPVGCSDSKADCSTSRLGIPHAVQTDPLQDTHTFSWGCQNDQQRAEQLCSPGVVAPDLLPCQQNAVAELRKRDIDLKLNLKAACSNRWVDWEAPSGAIHDLLLAHATRGCKTCRCTFRKIQGSRVGMTRRNHS